MLNYILISVLLFINIFSYGQIDFMNIDERNKYNSLLENDKIVFLNKKTGQYSSKEDYKKANKFSKLSLDIHIKNNNKDLAERAELSIAKLLYKTNNYTKTLAFCFKILNKNIEYNKQFEGEIYAIIGRIFNRYGAPKLALQYQMINYNRVKFKISHSAYYITEERGGYFINNKDYDSAKYYFNECLQKAKVIDDNYLISHAYNNIGYTAILAKDLDSVLINLNLAKYELSYNSIMNPRDSLLYLIITGNSSDCYFLKGEVSKGITNKETEYRLSKLYAPNEYQITVGVSLLKNYLDLNNNGMARLLLNELIQLTATTSISDDLHLKFIQEKISWNIRNNNALEVSKLIMQLNDLNEKIRQDFKAKSIGMGEAQVELQLIHTEKEKKFEALKLKNKDLLFSQMELEAQREKNRIYLGLIFLFAISIYIILITRKRLILSKKQNQMDIIQKELLSSEIKVNKLENEKLNLDLDLKMQDLTNISIHYSRKNNLHKEIINNLKQFKKNNTTIATLEIDNVIQLIKNEIFQDQTIELIQNNIDELNANFFNHLSQQFPDLTKQDLRLSSLIRLGLNNKEVSVIKSISAASAKVARYRLKKKFNLTMEDDIVDFLKQF